MKILPFRRSQADRLSPEELRDVLTAAASGPPRRLRGLCKRHKDQVAQCLDVLARIPADLDPTRVDDYTQRIGAVAHCLRTEFDAPQLWERLTGDESSNPMLMWDRWLRDLSERVDALEYDALIPEARAYIDLAREHAGQAARLYEAALLAALGSLLLHSGHADQAVDPYEAALALCRAEGDVEGETEHLLALMDVHRYLGQPARAARCGDEALQRYRQLALDPGTLVEQVGRLRAGEPACRVVLVTGDQEWELERYADLPQGPFELHFRTNRPSLHRCAALVQQGEELEARDHCAEALARYREAAEVDPHDPVPFYKMGLCYTQTGEYAQARQSFEDVERIAPGWLWCRTELWLARGLEAGTISVDELRRHRALEDPAMDPVEALQLAEDAVRRWPGFAPFYLVLGELQAERGNSDAAMETYRAGLERVGEPDLESRLLGALADRFPAGSTERKALLERTLSLEGNLLARAVAGFMRPA